MAWVQFSGSSASVVAKSGIASGDEVIFCLDGVEWIESEAAAANAKKREVTLLLCVRNNKVTASSLAICEAYTLFIHLCIIGCCAFFRLHLRLQHGNVPLTVK